MCMPHLPKITVVQVIYDLLINFRGILITVGEVRKFGKRTCAHGISVAIEAELASALVRRNVLRWWPLLCRAVPREGDEGMAVSWWWQVILLCS